MFWDGNSKHWDDMLNPCFRFQREDHLVSIFGGTAKFFWISEDGGTCGSCCECVLTVISYFLIVITFPFSLCLCIRVSFDLLSEKKPRFQSFIPPPPRRKLSCLSPNFRNFVCVWGTAADFPSLCSQACSSLFLAFAATKIKGPNALRFSVRHPTPA